MTIRKVLQGTTVEFHFEGWLDTQHAGVLAQALNELEDTTEKLVFDMANLEYISSAGIRQIFAAHKQMKGNLILRNVSSEIAGIFQMTGLSKIIHMEQ